MMLDDPTFCGFKVLKNDGITSRWLLVHPAWRGSACKVVDSEFDGYCLYAAACLEDRLTDCDLHFIRVFGT